MIESTNYITRQGAQRLQEELVELCRRQRPTVVQEVSEAAAQGDRSENAEYIYGKRKLREIDRRIQWLTKRLDSATVVDPRGPGVDVAFFGALVEVEDENGGRASYRIVGVDEVDPEHGCISWRSPLGRALLRRRPGDTVQFRRPVVRPPGVSPRAMLPAPERDIEGETSELTVISVRY